MIETLRTGSKGALVEQLQAFLRGAGLYLAIVDGDFGPRTDNAVRLFQGRADLRPDGVVGNMTWGALMTAGLTILPSDTSPSDCFGPNWPPKPADLHSLTQDERFTLFGHFEYESAPTPSNPEAIRITRRLPDFKIVEVELPPLTGVGSFPPNGKVLVEETVADMLRKLVRAWDDAAILDRVRTWGGMLSQRFVRGSRTTLSAHAWGTAFDINVPWNPLGARPALVAHADESLAVYLAFPNGKEGTATLPCRSGDVPAR